MPQHYQKDVWLFLDRLPYLELHLEPEIVFQDYYQQLAIPLNFIAIFDLE